MELERYNYYKEIGKETKYKKQNLKVTDIKKIYPYLYDVDSLALCAERKNVLRAFKNFFNSMTRPPKCKGRKDKNSYTTSNVNNNIRIENHKIRLPIVGFIKAKLHRNIPNDSKIKRCVISEDKTGKYYASLVLEIKKESNFQIQKVKGVGLDFKIGDVFVSSEGYKPIYSMPYRNSLKKLKLYEKMLNRKKIRSNNWWKFQNKIRRLHKKIAFQRKDFLHKISFRISNIYDFVSIESLSMEDIVLKLDNGINVYDTSYSRFCYMLKYKLVNMNKTLIKIDKWFPSSKMCSKCGNVKSKLELTTRVYECDKCGLVIDRDLNASINILTEGIRIFNNV